MPGRYRLKSAKYGAAGALLISFVLSWVWIWIRWLELKDTGATAGTTVFQSSDLLWPVLITGFGYFLVAMGAFCALNPEKAWWQSRRSSRRRKQLFLAGVFLAFLIIGVWPIFIGTAVGPYYENVAIDEDSRVIRVERRYLLREENLEVEFDEIAHVTYDYTPREPLSLPVEGGPRESVFIAKRDGARIYISKHGPPSGRRGLARTIARVTGKPLTEQ